MLSIADRNSDVDLLKFCFSTHLYWVANKHFWLIFSSNTTEKKQNKTNENQLKEFFFKSKKRKI